MLDAETLLLVDDHQAEVLELDLVAEQPVGADHHIDPPGRQPIDRLGDLGIGLEAAHLRHGDREAGVAGGEGVGVLGDQQRGRHQHRDLLAVLHRLERGAHRDLGLAVADIARDQPVHRDDLLHVGLDLVDGRQLVGGLGIGERVLEFALPGRVGAKCVALGGLPGGVELDQLAGDLANGLAGPRLAGLPVGPAHPVELR